jgi:hypothetical protein
MIFLVSQSELEIPYISTQVIIAVLYQSTPIKLSMCEHVAQDDNSLATAVKCSLYVA